MISQADLIRIAFGECILSPQTKLVASDPVEPAKIVGVPTVDGVFVICLIGKLLRSPAVGHPRVVAVPVPPHLIEVEGQACLVEIGEPIREFHRDRGEPRWFIRAEFLNQVVFVWGNSV